MFNLPDSTEISKKISKETFYTIGNVSSKDKEMFISDVEKIVWQHKLSEQTVNIASGTTINEIEVIYIQLRNKTVNIKLLRLIQQLIPYAIVFALEYKSETKLASFYNGILFQSEWSVVDALSIELKGLNLDAVWENIIVQISGLTIEESNTLDEQIAVDKERTRLKKEIERLEKQARNEKQPRKKFELVQKINKLKMRYKVRSVKSGMWSYGEYDKI